VLSAVFRSRQPGVDMSSIAHLPASAQAHALSAFVSGIDVVFGVGAIVMALATAFAVRLRTPALPTPSVRPAVAAPAALARRS
jgi:hypothetical protein